MFSMYIINTDAKSLGNRSPHDKWFKYKKAFSAGDYDRYGKRMMGKLCPGDVLVMYANKIGAVGIGVVTDFWNKDLVADGQLVYTCPYEDDEYSIDVDWVGDFRKRPVSAGDLRESNGNAPLRRAFIRVNDFDKMLEMFKERGFELP